MDFGLVECEEEETRDGRDGEYGLMRGGAPEEAWYFRVWVQVIVGIHWEKEENGHVSDVEKILPGQITRAQRKEGKRSLEPASHTQNLHSCSKSHRLNVPSRSAELDGKIDER